MLFNRAKSSLDEANLIGTLSHSSRIWLFSQCTTLRIVALTNGVIGPVILNDAIKLGSLRAHKLLETNKLEHLPECLVVKFSLEERNCSRKDERICSNSLVTVTFHGIGTCLEELLAWPAAVWLPIQLMSEIADRER